MAKSVCLTRSASGRVPGPGARSRIRVAVPLLPQGRYVALAILDYGGDQLAAAQIEYEVR